MVDLHIRTQMWEFLPKSGEYTKTAVEIKDAADAAADEEDNSTIEDNSDIATEREATVKSESTIAFNKVEMNSFEEYMSTGYYLYPRSSIAKTQLMMANHVGVIDSGYRNNLLCAFRYLPTGAETPAYKIPAGMRLVQICHPSLLPIYVNILTDEKYLTKTARIGGFGSTGGTV
jgi:dUTPase